MKKLLLFTASIFICGCMLSQIINVPGDYPTIQEGIDAAITGDTVLVAEDTWYENINFNGKAITLGSEFIMDGDTNHINNTIIDGSQAVNPDEASVITLDSGEDTTSVINGLSITGGQGSWSGMFSTQAGGGILCVNAGAKITNCKIFNNELSDENDAHGAGICCMVSNGDFRIIIDNNLISENEIYTSGSSTMAAGGGIFIGAATPAANITVDVLNNNINSNYCENTYGRADGGGIKVQINTLAAATYNIHHNIVQYNSISGASSSRGGGLCGIGTGANIHNNIFRYNSIEENSGQFRGAAICFKNSISDIHIYQNQFFENNSTLNDEDCTGAVSILDGWENGVFIDRNLFMNNEAYWGAALYVRRGYNLSITNNVFSENSAYGGGCISLNNPADDKDQTLVGKEYARAGIINNSFVNNAASGEGGAIRFSGAHTPPIIINSLFMNNISPTGADIVNLDDEKITVSFSRLDVTFISGPWSGSDNTPDDPYLESGDSLCHLSWQSHCIGAGTESLEFTDTTYFCPDHDYDGEPRPMCGLVDIGADESPFWVGLNEHKTGESGLQLNISPNPSSGIMHLQYSIPGNPVSSIQHPVSKLDVYSVDGIKVKTLMQGYQQPGEHEQSFDISDLPNGMCFVRLQVGNQVETIKIILIK